MRLDDYPEKDGKRAKPSVVDGWAIRGLLLMAPIILVGLPISAFAVEGAGRTAKTVFSGFWAVMAWSVVACYLIAAYRK